MTDHTLSAMSAGATALAALAAAAAVCVSWRGIAKQNAQAKASREDFKLSLAADLSMKLDDRFNADDFRQIRSHGAQALLSGQNLADAEEVFDFFETSGLLVRTGALTKELAYNFFSIGSTCIGWRVGDTFKKGAGALGHCGRISNTYMTLFSGRKG